MYYNVPCEYRGVTNVQHNFNAYFDLLTNKVCNLFKWEGLPDTVDVRALNLSLVLNGRVCFTKFNDNLYALTGNIGGEPNAYYEPTTYVIANPVLGSKVVKIRQKDGSSSLEGLDGILMANSDVDYESDRPRGGLFNLIYQTAGLLADNISSLNCSQINGRVSQIWTADSDVLARSAEEIIHDVYAGKPYKIVTQDMIDKVNALPTSEGSQSNTLLNLIEAHQYILANFFNEIGIAAQWNGKRERVNTAETELMTGSYDINIWNMLENRKKAVEDINALFGTSISVELNPEIFYQGSANATLGEDADSLTDEEENGVPGDKTEGEESKDEKEDEDEKEKEDDA